MKKSFPLEVPDRNPDRVLEAIKRDVRRYIKRERKKKLPEGVDFWDFDCKAGPDPASAGAIHLSALATTIDTAAKENWPAVYLEILAKPGHRQSKERKAPPES